MEHDAYERLTVLVTILDSPVHMLVSTSLEFTSTLSMQTTKSLLLTEKNPRIK